MNPDAPQSPDPTSPVPAKAKFRRYDMKKLLADPELRRKLIVQSTIATQAREGIDVSEADAQDSYYVVTQAERAAFFSLPPARESPSENDKRHLDFVSSITAGGVSHRIDVTLKDFNAIEDAPLTFDKIALIGPIFRDNPALSSLGNAWQGVISRDDERYFRFHWEVVSSEEKPWRCLYKGGDYSRFYYNSLLVIDWSKKAQSEFHRLRDLNLYFREGLTWPRRTAKGFNLRRLPSGCVFSDKGPAFLLNENSNIDYVLGVTNTRIFEYLFRAKTSFSWEIGVFASLPVPKVATREKELVGNMAAQLHDYKSEWDTGNEICTRFSRPWVLQLECVDGATKLGAALDQVLRHEAFLDVQLTETYAHLNDEVYRLYGVNAELRSKIEAATGTRPPELVWPQMEGKDHDQKRREHVDRLLTFLVKQILTEDEDHLVCLQRVAHEPPLLERLREKLSACFPAQDPSSLETEVINELKKKTKGYHRAESLAEWLHDVFFETHNALYQQRPLLWHLASSQTRTEPGFACLVHAHHFDADALAKLRSVYVKDRITVLRREAAQAGQDGKADLRLDLLALAEEVEAYDAKLAQLQEGAHSGPEGSERDYRILTPWKSAEDRPQGWHPDVDDGIKVNLAPLARTKLLRINLKLGTTESDE